MTNTSFLLSRRKLLQKKIDNQSYQHKLDLKTIPQHRLMVIKVILKHFQATLLKPEELKFKSLLYLLFSVMVALFI